MPIKKMKCFRKDYPRVQFFRDSYKNLDGKWDFKLDYDQVGEQKNYQNGFFPEYKIVVPFAYNCKDSLVDIQRRCDSVWYQRCLDIKAKDLAYDIFLHLEGSDYITTLYVNGCKVNQQKGCTYRQSYNISAFVHSGNNLIVIHCEDSFDKQQVRGKQRWKDHNFECYYEETTGIYKTVWLEYAPKTRIQEVKIDTDFYSQSAYFSFAFSGNFSKLLLKTQIFLEDKLVACVDSVIEEETKNFNITLDNSFVAWDVLKPALYDVKLQLYDNGDLIDEVLTYFGIRSIEIKDGFFYLNGKKIFQKLILDQGYWRQSGYTAPHIDAFLEDIMAMRQMGFNGARMHQKVEDERFLYFADVLGFLIWCEMPSMYENTESSRTQFIEEWQQVVTQQYNHPSIIVWTPFNESWGIEEVKTSLIQQDFVNQVYTKTKELDSSRPVISNDGWEHTISDILTLHHYEQDGQKLHQYYETIEKIITGIWPAHHKGAFADGYEYKGQPIIISEFGGCALYKDIKGSSWGYGNGVATTEAFLERFRGLIDGITSLPFLCGYCYTQLNDVSQEVNGLLDADHKLKFEAEQLALIQSKF